MYLGQSEKLSLGTHIVVTGAFSRALETETRSLGNTLLDQLAVPLADAGLTIDDLTVWESAYYVGVDPRLSEQVGPLPLSAVLGQKTGLIEAPGMTIEVGGVAGAMALHAARGAIENGTTRLALVLELLPDSQGGIQIHGLVLRSLADALAEQSPILGSIAASKVGCLFDDQTRTKMIDQCRQTTDLEGEIVVRDISDQGIQAIITNLEEMDGQAPWALGLSGDNGTHVEVILAPLEELHAEVVAFPSREPVRQPVSSGRVVPMVRADGAIAMGMQAATVEEPELVLAYQATNPWREIQPDLSFTPDWCQDSPAVISWHDAVSG